MRRIRLWQLALALPALACASLAHAGSCQITPLANLSVTMRGLRASVPVKVNGRDTEFWLDSGAWFSIMSKARAQELSLPLMPAPAGLRVNGIGGSSDVELARVKQFGIVGQSLTNVEFLVGGSDIGNALIGRNLLALADTEFDLAHGSVKLLKSKGCEKTALTYWAPGKPYFVARMPPAGASHDFRVRVAINGVPIIAAIDSGAPTSLLTRRAAQRAGLDLAAPDVRPLAGIGGFGRKLEKGWIAPVASVAIGEEQVLHTHLHVIAAEIGDGSGPEMLLGADFLLAHHLYVAQEQRQIFFTYTGGTPFLTEGARPAPATEHAAPATLPAGTHVVQADDTATDPKTADEFARRAAARLAAGQAIPALADYDAALALTPDDPLLHRDRAAALFRAGRFLEGRTEFDKAIALAPNDPRLLVARARMRIGTGDHAGALSDADAAMKTLHPGALDTLPAATIYVEIGHADRAIPIYDAVIAAHPDDSKLPEFRNGRCWARALANRELPAALEDCNKALKARPGLPAFLDSRGLVKYRMKDYTGALADYDAAITAAPGLAFSRYMRGLTRIALGQVDAGKAESDAAGALDRHTIHLGHYYNLHQ